MTDDEIFDAIEANDLALLKNFFSLLENKEEKFKKTWIFKDSKNLLNFAASCSAILPEVIDYLINELKIKPTYITLDAAVMNDNVTALKILLNYKESILSGFLSFDIGNIANVKENAAYSSYRRISETAIARKNQAVIDLVNDFYEGQFNKIQLKEEIHPLKRKCNVLEEEFEKHEAFEEQPLADEQHNKKVKLKTNNSSETNQVLFTPLKQHQEKQSQEKPFRIVKAKTDEFEQKEVAKYLSYKS